MFGRRKKTSGSPGGPGAGPADEPDVGEQTSADPVTSVDLESGDGPYDLVDLDVGRDQLVTHRLDLGSVLVPMPEGGQLQVEMAPNGDPQAVHMVTQHGRITVAAYAAPKSPGQWREVVGDLSESLRSDNAAVSMETGPWGRELVGVTPTADLRFLGVDGYRWMIRCVAAGPAGSVAEGSPLVETARSILRNTVVDRGSEPQPVRTPLPVLLPTELAEQLAAAHQQQIIDQQPGEPAIGAIDNETTADPATRRGSSGSAMQQLGN